MFGAKTACVTPKKYTWLLTEHVPYQGRTNNKQAKSLKPVLELLLLIVLMVTCVVISLWYFNKNFNNVIQKTSCAQLQEDVPIQKERMEIMTQEDRQMT